jgi:hypothetical protein
MHVWWYRNAFLVLAVLFCSYQFEGFNRPNSTIFSCFTYIYTYTSIHGVIPLYISCAPSPLRTPEPRLSCLCFVLDCSTRSGETHTSILRSQLYCSYRPVAVLYVWNRNHGWGGGDVWLLSVCVWLRVVLHHLIGGIELKPIDSPLKTRSESVIFTCNRTFTFYHSP